MLCTLTKLLSSSYVSSCAGQISYSEVTTSGSRLAQCEHRKGVTGLRQAGQLAATAVLAAILVAHVADSASAQSVSAVTEPQGQMQAPPKAVKPMTPQRIAWLKGRCSQLVAFFDRYGVGRGENSDGPRNHTRIGAAIECEQTHYRTGIDTMAALLVRKAFDVPKPGVPVVEPEDLEAPDITNPTRPWWW